MMREDHYRKLVSFEVIGQNKIAEIEPRIVAQE